MAKHVADTGHTPVGSKRAREFTRIERAELPSAQARELQHRAKDRAGGRKRAYLKIDRRKTEP